LVRVHSRTAKIRQMMLTFQVSVIQLTPSSVLSFYYSTWTNPLFEKEIFKFAASWVIQIFHFKNVAWSCYCRLS
jgi:hypothetical protein